MFRFENESFLYSLFIIFIFVIIYVILQYKDRKRNEQYIDKQLLTTLTPQRSKVMKHLKFSILMLAFACFIVAAANPQTVAKIEKGKRKGVDIMICLDVSNSMLAQDIQPNRLQACKMAISHLIDKLEGDRIGLVAFAGKSFVQLPITTDYAAAKMFVNQVNTDIIPVQGTDISAALSTAQLALIPENEAEQQGKGKIASSKVIILVSDGETHYPESQKTATDLAQKGIVIHTIGIGSTIGEKIPISSGSTQYKKDKDGNTVITRLNEQVLKELATYGKGVYIHADNTNMGFESILNEIKKMDKSEFKDVDYKQFESGYQYPLGIGILLLIIESLLFAVKPKWKDWLWKQRQKYGAGMLLTVCLLLAMGCHTGPTTLYEASLIDKGNAVFKLGEDKRDPEFATIDTARAESDTTGFHAYTEALKFYDIVLNTEPANENIARFNQMDAFYRQHQFDTLDSIANYLKNNVQDKQFLAKVFFNKGNAQMEQQYYSQAIESYKDVLRRNPSDFDAKYNLEYAKKMMKSNKNKSPQQQQQQQQENKDQQKQDQKENGQNKEQNKEKQQSKEGQKPEPQESAAEREKKQATERQLDALQQNERQTQQKVNRKRIEVNLNGSNKQEKDW
ncbi:MAG: VWA domain-containing protein [Bacteroidales bacterium]|jgi:tetratricopeptide (TPR) repeat protein/uncharacterized protein YegL|nr:VWA domain-containing protein [Bacteroidales bacterium]MDD4394562.1 VWA domain-containing protein [Bacteroidales bacterium]